MPFFFVHTKDLYARRFSRHGHSYRSACNTNLCQNYSVEGYLSERLIPRRRPLKIHLFTEAATDEPSKKFTCCLLLNGSFSGTCYRPIFDLNL